MNRVTIIGRLGKTPDVRETPNGVKVVSFSIAVDRKYNKGETDWFECVAWRNTAEFIGKYFNKGDLIGIDGYLTARTWTGKENNQRKIVEINVENVDALSSKNTASAKKSSEFIEVDDDGYLPF